MPVPTPFCQRFEQLPPSLPVFPLAGTIVLPQSFLPLNIFEPRYINMVQDAMRSDQLIGMILPADKTAKPALSTVGCAARIVRYEEIPDGRFRILLAGLCRFKAKQELASVRGYRIVTADWSPYKNDYDAVEPPAKPAIEQLLSLVQKFCEDNKIRFNRMITDKMSDEEVVNNSAIYLPLKDSEKQFLLESPTVNDRLTMLIALLESESQESTIKH